VLASNDTACNVSCGVVVNEAGAAALDTAVAQVNATTCATFFAEGCKPNPAPPCAPIPGVYCIKGQCSGFPGSACEASGGTCVLPALSVEVTAHRRERLAQE
jgi:hypothetical protein